MHEDVALVGIHYDEAVVAGIVEEFQPTCVALGLACLNWSRDRRCVGLVGIITGNGLSWSWWFVGLALGRGEGMNGNMLRVVQVSLGFASGVV